MDHYGVVVEIVLMVGLPTLTWKVAERFFRRRTLATEGKLLAAIEAFKRSKAEDHAKILRLEAAVEVETARANLWQRKHEKIVDEVEPIVESEAYLKHLAAKQAEEVSRLDSEIAQHRSKEAENENRELGGGILETIVVEALRVIRGALGHP